MVIGLFLLVYYRRIFTRVIVFRQSRGEGRIDGIVDCIVLLRADQGACIVGVSINLVTCITRMNL